MKTKLLKRLRKEAKKAVRVTVEPHPCGCCYDIRGHLPLSAYKSQSVYFSDTVEPLLKAMRRKYITEWILAERAKQLNDK